MRAHTKVIRDGILSALKQGPATRKEIERRMGIYSSLDRHLQQLRADGAIMEHGRRRPEGGRGAREIIFALTEAGKIAA